MVLLSVCLSADLDGYDHWCCGVDLPAQPIRCPADQVPLPEWLWVILHSPGKATVMGNITFETGYCLPRDGVKVPAAASGPCCWLPERRQIFPLASSAWASLSFRAINNYGDPRPWELRSTTLFTFFVSQLHQSIRHPCFIC